MVFICHNYRCAFFQWAEFDDDGEPPWVPGLRRDKEVDVEERRVENG